MTFGLKSAPIIFQRIINTLFGELLGNGVHAYLDDIIVASPSADPHFAKLEAVLRTLETAGLKAKLTKCELLKEEISFPGPMVDGEGIHTQYMKIDAIKNFPGPKTAENVFGFRSLRILQTLYQGL